MLVLLEHRGLACALIVRSKVEAAGIGTVGISELPSLLEPYLKILGHHHFGDHTTFLFLILPVCHQRTDHGGSGSGLSHRQHPCPTQWLSAPEGSKAVTGRKRALEPDLRSRLQVDPAGRPLWELRGQQRSSPRENITSTCGWSRKCPRGSPLLDVGEWELPHSCGCALRIKGRST